MEILLALGTVAIVVASLFARRTGVATPLILLGIGMIVSYVPWIPNPELKPEWILAGVLPPLLYASAVQMPVVDLRRSFRMITWLSVVLVILSALAVGLLVHWLVPGIPFAAGVALGAVVSPTDAVAATAIGKRLGLPHRVMTVLEGESLVNDASALVLLRTALAALSVGFTFWGALGTFLYAVVVAGAIGAAVGLITVWARSRMNDPVLATAISFIVPFLAAFPAERAHASGVVAVVVAGLVTGTKAMRMLSARDRQNEHTNWTTIQFLVENGVFLVMGLQVKGLIDEVGSAEGMREVVLLTAVVFVILLVVRALGVAGFLWAEGDSERRIERKRAKNARISAVADTLTPSGDRQVRRLEQWRRRLTRSEADLNYWERAQFTRKGALVISWAGMRGVVTLAAALSMDVGVPHRTEMILIAFMVAVATLVIFGGTLPWVIRRTGLSADDHAVLRTESQGLWEELITRARAEVGPIEDIEIDGEKIPPEVSTQVLRRYQRFAELGTERLDPTPAALTRRQQSMAVQRRWIAELQNALTEEQSIGAFSSTTLAQARKILDSEELRLDQAR